ncbi:MAG: metallophosphoesterase [Bryobacteraceae bacterium]
MPAPQPKPDASALRPVEPQKMVDWFAPAQLSRTAVDVLISNVFGQRIDNRLIEALSKETDGMFDYSRDASGKPREEIVIDYVADTGDGWNSTYAIAYWVAQRSLPIPDVPGRADLLVFGGDEVYPVASRQEYERRLVAPYETALAWTDPPHPHVFAIPGNHDWYDSLVSFTRLFCAKEWFGGWLAPQKRSYFALRLPQGWWLIGTDIQLGADIDEKQLEYFRKNVVNWMGEGDRVILCNALPFWVMAEEAKGRDREEEKQPEANLRFLSEKLFNGRVQVYLAGDLHHYRRHENKAGVQKITAGGGGAFLHPTHAMQSDTLEDGAFQLRCTHPTPEQSRKETLRLFAFAFRHREFGYLIGLLYVLTVWTVLADLSPYGISEWTGALGESLRKGLASPMAMFWMVALFTGFFLFTETRRRYMRYILGGLHAVGHLTLVFLLGWGMTRLVTQPPFGWQFGSVSYLLAVAAALLFGGMLLGSTLFGLYLWISVNWLSEHKNDAFSSLAVEDWKSFLRMKVGKDGSLTIYPIGLDRVPRRWQVTDRPLTEPRRLPDDPDATAPRLLEKPVVVKPSGGATTQS